MKVHELFELATGKTVCSTHDCPTCRVIYGYPTDACFCPRDLTKKQTVEVTDFIEKVVDLLRKKEMENVFDWEMTDEEFVNMLMEMADND